MVITFVLLAYTIQGFYSLHEWCNKFVVDIVKLPSLPISRIFVVIIVKHLLTDIIYLEPIADPIIHLIGYELILYDESPKFVFIHQLCLLIDVDCFTLDRSQLIFTIFNLFFYFVLSHKLPISYILVLPQRSHVLIDRFKGEQIWGSELHL